MTQQPYGYPQQPAPQYPAQTQQGYPQAPQQPYSPPIQAYPQQGYPQPYGPPPYTGQPQPGYGQQPPAPQGPPPMAGSLDAFNAQPSGGAGPGISFKGAPLGTTYAGTVTRDVRDSDVQQDTDYQTKAPLFFRDGKPRWVMVVPLQLDQPDAQHPDGAAGLYVRGGVRDAIAQAMSELGLSGPPKGGDRIVLTLTERKDTGQGSPKSIYHVTYTRDGQSSSPLPQPVAPQGYPQQGQAPYQQAPYQQAPYQQAPYQQAYAPQPPAPTYQQPQAAPYASEPVQPPASSMAPAVPQQPQQPAQSPEQQPQGQAVQSPLIPGGLQLDPEQAKFLEQLRAQQAGGQG